MKVRLMRWATLPLVAIGVMLIGMFLRGPLTWAFGHDTAGKIVDIRPYSRGEDGRRFDVTYTYGGPSGINVIQYGRIDTAGAPPPKVGEKIPIRRWSVGPYSNAELRDEAVSGGSGYVCVGLFVAVWCGGVGIAALVAWLDPIRQRRLLRDGRVAEGVVTGKKNKSSGRSANYRVFYTFRTTNDAEQAGEDLVSRDLFEKLREGDGVTVLYDPSKPTRNGSYEAMDFEVVGAGA